MSAAPDPVSYPMEEHRKWSWRPINIKLILYNAVLMPVLTLVVWNINAKGLQSLPGFGLKLSKAFPGFNFMSRYEYWRDLTIAHPSALLILFFVWLATLFLVRILFFGVQTTKIEGRSLRVVTCVCLVFILADIWLYYRGVSGMGFFGMNGTFTGFLATVVYAGVVWLAAVFHFVLKEDLM